MPDPAYIAARLLEAGTDDADYLLRQMENRPDIEEVYSAFCEAFALAQGFWQHHYMGAEHGKTTHYITIIGIPTVHCEQGIATRVAQATANNFGIQLSDVVYDPENEELNVWLKADQVNAPPPKTEEEANAEDLGS